MAALVVPALIAGLPAGVAQADAEDPGVIRGSVFDESAGRPASGISVLLSGTGRIRLEETTDERGRYRFDGLPTGDDRLYSIAVIHEDGLFAGRPIDELGAADGRAVVETRLRIWDTTSDPAAVLVQRHNIFVNQGDGGLGIIESLTVVNTSNAAYIGRARNFGRAAAQASFAFALPGGASDGRMLPDSDFFGTPVAGTDTGFGLAVAIPPGEWNILFAYRLPGSGGIYNLSRTALYPTLNAAVHVAEPLTVESNRLTEAGAITPGDSRYRRWMSSDVIEAGEPLQISVTAEAGSGWLAGGFVAVMLAVVLGAVAVVRNRSRRGRGAPAPQTREDLVAAIAELDLRHDAGDMEGVEWERRRAELKEDLERATPQTTR